MTAQDLPRLPRRDPAAHKGECGRVLIVAGSRDMPGAAVLSALGALRGGAGLVRVLTPRSAHPIVASAEVCAMSGAVDDEDGMLSARATDALIAAARWADVVAVGPGLGTSPGVATAVEGFLRQNTRPAVIDADALHHLAHGVGPWPLASFPAVLTPHPGELARLRAGRGLSPLADWKEHTGRLVAALETAVVSQAVVVLKGAGTVVCDPAGRYAVNETGNAGMAAGGMGDVLTGLLAALMGQGMPPFEAARLAVFVHGAAGDLLARRVGPVGFLARELADAIPAILGPCVAGA